MKKHLPGVFLAVTLAGVSAFTKPVQASFDCDPNAEALTQAQSVRVSDPLRAQSIITAALKINPHDFHTAYLLGLTLLDPSKYNPGPEVGRSTLVRAAAKFLDPRVAQCAATHGWYSIYNEIGASYYNSNDLTNAQKYFRLAEYHASALSPSDRSSLYSNLGLLALIQKRLPESETYYRKAQAAAAQNAPVVEQKDIASKLAAVHILRTVPPQH